MKKIFTWIMCAALLGANAYAQQQDERLAVTISADKEAYHAGDRATFTVKFRNTGDTKIYRNTYRDAIVRTGHHRNRIASVYRYTTCPHQTKMNSAKA